MSVRYTSVAGASKIYLGGVCSYTEEMKNESALGVGKNTLKEYAVHLPQVASEMSYGS